MRLLNRFLVYWIKHNICRLLPLDCVDSKKKAPAMDPEARIWGKESSDSDMVCNGKHIDNGLSINTLLYYDANQIWRHYWHHLWLGQFKIAHTVSKRNNYCQALCRISNGGVAHDYFFFTWDLISHAVKKRSNEENFWQEHLFWLERSDSSVGYGNVKENIQYFQKVKEVFW